MFPNMQHYWQHYVTHLCSQPLFPTSALFFLQIKKKRQMEIVKFDVVVEHTLWQLC